MEIEQEHPIPQQISSYSFRLVGDMTLKQFFQVAMGVVLGLLTYASPLPPIVKWPVVALFVLLGVGFAFFTIEDRPLETWIVIFFKAIYTPTEFIWKKTEKEPVYFQEPTKTVTTVTPTSPENIQPNQEPRVNLQLNLERSERSILQNIGNLFLLHHNPIVSAQPVPTISGAIPSRVPTAVEKQKVPESTPAAPPGQATTKAVDQTLVARGQIEGTQAQFSPDAAPPSPPTLPNTIVGQVMDKDKKIIEGAILEIKDNQGRPVRALKSNKAGHFMVITPLADGDYKILVEKEGFDFEPIKLKTEGELVPPIAVRAK
ncbi:hypothetical protein A3D84_00430 [Candidatus Woesebacteria bacterium RIFCSPHIGHO2_02_FULL_42_20]|uniref:PrgI family protein n=1 Tax=Candidatus Woesebacteria bacterium RIFCSPHIGHO2_12_FULL_41_24 TaxID=1802510 RepID=A0A1F8AV55_9BACT|nr:MAG: hypothetical protein A2W15_01930 [Candidatus Woesebacteria bacterium RBG_16_41_13]OGM29716.1 MAG: hypothetical protein A2873_02350 [Candidatus Woesebacteria bacterium RIFCSPHIGHO2_01_FULL_42_80]OGM35244.1 MAG: hypothetical protein A3D84_00430 [Candidatus Woesebacteria bacterium RIFCSPHIGHO2_02_FULL_42_20]OGM55138.1 MAG: hypothetical protein A3E44_04435 [Candidatus Woesebacteria bacterium RIFCSPHIGHO2_12_FULL_41_24]OGM67710.1 MAG: hypothetical protein A2969_02140 [Candidatus Woesebacteri